MSFSNTSTPKKPTGKAKYKVEMRPSKHNAYEYYLTPEQEAEFIRLYPITFNRKIMQLFGLSFATMQRFKTELGLKKNMAVIRKKQAALVKKICEKNGYYDSLRGKSPSPQALEATRRKRAEGFHPLLSLKENNPRKYKKLLKKRGEQHKALISRERRRYDIGLPPVSDIPVSFYAGIRFAPCETSVRCSARKRGYIVGSADPELGERHFLYFTEATVRAKKFEQHAKSLGFEIKMKPTTKH